MSNPNPTFQFIINQAAEMVSRVRNEEDVIANDETRELADQIIEKLAELKSQV